MKEILTPTLTQNAMSYEAYRELIDKLLAEKRATGDYQDNSEEILEYSRVNVARMRRGDKTFKLNEDLKQQLENSTTNQLWLVLTEGWCGDAAQNIPALVQIAAASPRIEIRFLLRDDNLDLMDKHLTNGGRAIPKLVALNADSLEELGSWGPRPAAAQALITELKEQGMEHDAFIEEVHKWYSKDRYQAIQKEMLELVKVWS